MLQCINNTNITNYHYCFYFYNSEVLRMTSAADVASFNVIVGDSAQKPGAYETLQKQFRLSATQGLPTVLAAAQLKKNFLSVRCSFISREYRFLIVAARSVRSQKPLAVGHNSISQLVEQ